MILGVNEHVENEHQQHFNDNFNSYINDIYICFYVTVILIVIFLLFAFFEIIRVPFLQTFFPNRHPNRRDVEYPVRELGHSLPLSVSILMPEEEIPTFIANPAPLPSEGISWSSHQHIT
ncbi:unnamed protein product [Trifolium pratense]|uniref:Uncharacterized protein n=1 Tax=Trifolium pratense TaxID=57577 RepID=A0ACB0JAW5_TRIPR|nr:unnamed protein product [Trifolium pratense]